MYAARFDARARAERRRRGGAAEREAPSRPISRSPRGRFQRLNVPGRAAPRVPEAHRAAVSARPASRCRRTRLRDRPGRPRVRSDTRARVWRGCGARTCRVFLGCCCVGLDASLPSRRRVNSLARAVRQWERKFKTKCVPRDVWVNSLQLFFSAKSELRKCEEKRRDRSALDRHSLAGRPLTLRTHASSVYDSRSRDNSSELSRRRSRERS